MRVLLLSLLTLLSACGRSSSLADCPDATCRDKWVLERWVSDPDLVVKSVAALEDPLARQAISVTLTRAYPGQVQRVCETLPQGRDRAQCMEKDARPHLQQIRVPEGSEERASAAPSEPSALEHGLAPSRTLQSPWSPVVPETVPCTTLARVCQVEVAEARAAAGEAEGAAAACRAVDQASWQAECFFMAAEAAVKKGDLARAPDAAMLCLGSATFLTRCLGHVVRQVGAGAPALSAPPAAWAPFAAAVAESQSRLGALDTTLGEIYADHAWSYGVRRAFESASALSGALLTTLPPEAARHVRTALVWRLWRLEAAPTRDLAAWVARAAEILASPDPVAFKGVPALGPADGPLRNLWTHNLKGERDLPQTTFLGNARRVWSEDPTTDLTLVVLEVAAHLDPPEEDLLREGLAHPDELVRWTAARLLQGIGSLQALGPARSDASALVRARAEPPQRGPVPNGPRGPGGRPDRGPTPTGR